MLQGLPSLPRGGKDLLKPLRQPPPLVYLLDFRPVSPRNQPSLSGVAFLAYFSLLARIESKSFANWPAWYSRE